MTLMRALFLVLCSVSLLVVGCKSMSTRESGGGSLATDNKWLTDYRHARALAPADPKGACRIYSELALEPKFPVAPLAQLRAWEICEEPITPAMKRDELPAWLADLSLDIGLKVSAKNGDKPAELALVSEKSKQRLIQSQKLKWIDRALTLARELKNEEAEQELLKRQYMIAPRLKPAIDASDYLNVASDYRANRQFARAHEFYEKVFRSDRFKLDEKVIALKGKRLAYKNARDDENHIAAAMRLVKYLRKAEKLNPKSTAVRQAAYESQTYYARAVWTLGRGGEAAQVFDEIEKRYKGRMSLAELYWLRGRLAEESGDLEAVSEHMDRAIKERVNDGELRDKILWYSAWNERRRGNLARASEILAQLDETTTADFTRVRALFWLGKTFEEMKQPEDSRRVLERLIALDPLGYYGLLAHRHLGIEISFKRGLPATAETTGALTLDTAAAEWLTVLEEREALASLLDQAADQYRKSNEQTNEGWATLFKYYAKGGLYQKMYATLSSLTSERRKSILESQPELLFPQPWNDDVRLAGLQHGVDEELIYGVMRQESAFDPRARSGADAFGLMQILPEVAEKIGAHNKIPYSSMDDLYQPATNIQLGAAHLKDLLRRHRGQFILAVASYNASENAIRGWMKTRFRGDSLEFIEEIPYEETRVYVRLVMRNLIFYSLLKSKSASIEFPAWVLKLDPS